MNNSGSVNIERIGIDQETEYAVEEVLTYWAEEGDCENFSDAFQVPDDNSYLPGGNILSYLDFVVGLAEELITRTNSPRRKWRLRANIKRMLDIRDIQAKTYMQNGVFLAFPTSPHAGLSDHLKIGRVVKGKK